jgi:hypothetical protein
MGFKDFKVEILRDGGDPPCLEGVLRHTGPDLVIKASGFRGETEEEMRNYLLTEAEKWLRELDV